MSKVVSKVSAKESSGKKVSKDDAKKNKNATDNESDDEKTDKVSKPCNKNTEKAGLTFDVNTRYKWLDEYYQQECFRIAIKEDKDKDMSKYRTDDHGNHYDTMGFAGAQYALSLIEETLTAHLVKLAYSKASATKVKLYEIDAVALKETVRNDVELNSIFGNHITAFKSSYDYLSELKINKSTSARTDEVSAFVERQLNSGNVRLKEDGFKFLLYLFQVNRTMLANCAFQIVRYAKKKTVCQDAIMCAVNIYYTHIDEKDFFNKVTKKFEDVEGRISEAQLEERKKADAKKKVKGDDDEEEEAAPAKPRGKGAKKASADEEEAPVKSSGKKAKKSSTDDDEEDAPAKPSAKKAKKASADDEEEAPAKPSAKKTKKQADSDDE